MSDIYPVVIDYNRKAADFIKIGEYTEVSSGIELWDFPTKGYADQQWSQEKCSGIAEIHIELIHFDGINRDKIIKEFNKNNMRPVDLLELLALDIRFPDLQRLSPIIAFDSVLTKGYCNPAHYCPSLAGNSRERNLYLYYIGHTVQGDKGDSLDNHEFTDVSFAVVRK